MKDYLLELAASKEGLSSKLNIMREYLQAYILKILHAEGWFRHTAFVGGTALRFLYRIPRFSEDLDFSAVQKPKQSFESTITKIKSELISAGYEIAVVYSDRNVVCYAMIKFPKLMHEAGLSPFREQTLSIKLEVDTRPPQGAVLETQVVNLHFPIAFLSYDKASLFAGKCHALLSRKYTKGRDFFDLGWYLSKWRDITPNFKLLKNALKQTTWKGEIPTDENWRSLISQTVQKTDWVLVTKDVQNFLESPGDLEVFTKPNVLKLIESAEHSTT